MPHYHQKNILNFITRILHPEIAIDEDYFNEKQKFWEQVLKIGSSHLVLPAIYAALKRKKIDSNPPKDLLLYLNKISNLNQKRNEQILKQIEFLSNILNNNQIEHVFLKGSAMLVIKQYDARRERMIGDIDLLICKEHLHKAKKLLINEGFYEIDNELSFVKDLISVRHLKRIIHPNHICSVELHSELLVNSAKSYIKSQDFLKYKELSQEGFWIPSKYHLWLHSIYNWQFNDKGYKYNTISLRCFVDVVYLEPFITDKNLYKNKVISHFYSLYSPFISNYQNTNYLSTLFFELKLKYPKSRLFFDLIIKFKSSFSLLCSRLILIIKSNTYRNRLIKNRKLLIKRILIFLKK